MHYFRKKKIIMPSPATTL